jgi:hypothetical protein
VTAPPKDLVRLRAKACEVLARIEDEPSIAMLDHQLYVAVQDEIPKRRPTSDGTFLSSSSNIYRRAQLMAIRRLTDKLDGTDSLWGLIERIRANPAIASRAAVVAEARFRSDGEMASYTDSEFGVRYQSADETPDRLDDLQARLSAHFEDVILCIDRVVVHRDPCGRLPISRLLRSMRRSTAWLPLRTT